MLEVMMICRFKETNMRIVKLKQPPALKSPYERKIICLEEELEAARTEAKGLKENAALAKAEVIATQEKHVKELIAFMSGLYTQLGKIQQELLSHLGSLNSRSTSLSQAKLETTLKALSKQFKLLNHVEQEVKTSAGLLGED